MSRYLHPTTDFGFKKIFSEEANKDILASFITDVIFEKAFAAAAFANMTAEDLSLYHRAMKYEWDDYARYTTAEQRGEMKGELKGVTKVAQALLQKGSDPAFVAEVTGLSMAQIQQLQKPPATIHKLYPTKE